MKIELKEISIKDVVEGLTVLIELECLGCGKIFKVVSV